MIRYLDEYRNPEFARQLVERIRNRPIKRLRFMEFCGGHTAAIMKHGLRQLLYPRVEMLAGPGCPVCVTSIDRAIALATEPEVIVVTFGDMLRVPGSRSSLRRIRADGGDVRVVYSPLDALEIAQKNPEKSIVFIGIGFETTAPGIAASLIEAKNQGVTNYFLLSLHKLCPPVMKVLLDSGEIRLDGIICPGHVSAIIGSRPYGFIPRDYGIACVIAGFEPLDILLAIDMLGAQIERGEPEVEIAYRRGVKPEGNPHATRIMEQVFEVGEADWRGIGTVAESGLRLREEYQSFNAESAFHIELPPASEPKGCLCGEILRGVITPLDCKLFGKSCTPEYPVGPCMVSSEGTCAAYFLYGDSHGR